MIYTVYCGVSVLIFIQCIKPNNNTALLFITENVLIIPIIPPLTKHPPFIGLINENPVMDSNAVLYYTMLQCIIQYYGGAILQCIIDLYG